jgi:hypothetical protein
MCSQLHLLYLMTRTLKIGIGFLSDENLTVSLSCYKIHV